MDATHIVRGRYDVLIPPKYHNCYKTYQSRLLWQYRKIQEVKYFGRVYYAVYQHFLNDIDYLDYHPSIHTDNDPITSQETKYQRYKRNTCNSCMTRQYVYLSFDQTEYLSKLIVNIEKINKKLHCDSSNIPSRQTCFGPLTFGESWGIYSNAKKKRKLKQNL